ncbi:MAG TPA: hypothetical protein VGM60_10265 [Pseudonocardia sp.]
MTRMTGQSKLLVVVAALLAVAGVGAAGWFGYSWWSAANSNSVTVVQARDGALRASRELAVILQSVDPDQPEQGMQAWQAAATGSLLQQLQRDHDKYITRLKQAPTRSTATVLDAALTGLDANAGTASAIAALDVMQVPVVNGAAGPPSTRQLRVKLTLNRTDAGWKIASAGLVNAA